jgi:2-methylcitrate dehydratase PrpD
MLDDQRIAALAARVALSEDKAMTARLPAERPARVRVTLADGRVLEAERRSNRGDADDPYPRAAIEEKFLSLASPAWGAARAAGLLRATQEIDAPDGFAALARLLPAA